MTEIIAYIRRSLEEIYSPEEIGSLIRLMLEDVCGLLPHQLLMDKDKQLAETEVAQLKKMVERLRQHEPIQYILGRTNFCGLFFQVDPAVLIPRPETEELVELIVKEYKNKRIRLLDIGTGSGCIAIAAGKYLPEAELVGLDISEDALKIAQVNAEVNQVELHLLRLDILSEAETETGLSGLFDVIVSNPPYVMEKERDNMGRNVLDYEPSAALFVPDNDPQLFYRRIGRLGLRRLKRDGTLYFEVNAQCGHETVEMLYTEGYSRVELMPDIRGKDRIIKAKQ